MYHQTFDIQIMTDRSMATFDKSAFIILTLKIYYLRLGTN